MNELEVRSKLEGIIRETFPAFRRPLSDSTTAKDVPGWDSVAHFNLIMKIEDEFRIELDASESYTLENIGQLTRFVCAVLGI
jgi:acyl carrier protein